MSASVIKWGTTSLSFVRYESIPYTGTDRCRKCAFSNSAKACQNHQCVNPTRYYIAVYKPTESCTKQS